MGAEQWADPHAGGPRPDLRGPRRPPDAAARRIPGPRAEPPRTHLAISAPLLAWQAAPRDGSRPAQTANGRRRERGIVRDPAVRARVARPGGPTPGERDLHRGPLRRQPCRDD